MRKVREILMELGRQEHSFIDHTLERETGDVKEIATIHFAGIANGRFGKFADDIELALEGHVVGELGIAADEYLPHEGFGIPGGSSQRIIIGGDRAPSEETLPLL